MCLILCFWICEAVIKDRNLIFLLKIFLIFGGFLFQHFSGFDHMERRKEQAISHRIFESRNAKSGIFSIASIFLKFIFLKSIFCLLANSSSAPITVLVPLQICSSSVPVQFQFSSNSVLVQFQFMLSKKFHSLEYGFHIYDEKSPIPFSVPDGHIQKNVDPKILQKSRKFSVKKLRLYLLKRVRKSKTKI